MEDIQRPEAASDYYVYPELVASYTVEEMAAEAAECVIYEPPPPPICP